jgi:chaperonin GroEL
MITEVLFSQLDQVKAGAKIIADAVKSTLGPNGRGVLIKRLHGFPFITKDGVTVAESMRLSDPMHNIGAELVKEVARKTVDGAGDGTTTATILTESILTNGLRQIAAGANPIEMKKGIDKAVEFVVKNIKEQSQKADTLEKLTSIAKISTNNDEEISAMIAEAITKVGKDGVVRVEESNTDKTELKITQGMNLERGFISPHFVNQEKKMMCEFTNPLILLTDKRITTFSELLPALQISAERNRPLLLICEDIEGEALATLIMNKKGARISVCAVRAPYMSGQKKTLLEDIAILTGGKVVSEDVGLLLTKVDETCFGHCDTASISKETTVLVGGAGTKEEVDARIMQIRTEITDSKDEMEIKRLKSRLAKINGGVGIIYVGGSTETEMQEKKFRVEDAIYATVAAEEEGMVPGGGLALFNVSKAMEVKDAIQVENEDQSLGVKVIHDAIREPMKVLCENSGKSHEVIISKISTDGTDFGWDARNDTYVHMFNAGIVDPTKVVRLAIENSASVVGLLLTTKATIYEKDIQRIPNTHLEG